MKGRPPEMAGLSRIGLGSRAAKGAKTESARATPVSTGHQPNRVSSPAATGGAGTFFEQHVNAHWLALLLTRAIPPVLTDSVVTEVHLQAEHLGWSTDDFLVVADRGQGQPRRLVGQVKRSFTVSAW